MRAYVAYMIKGLFVVLTCAVMVVPAVNVCFAASITNPGGASSASSSISSVQRLNLSRGKISGERIEYSLSLPASWRGYLIVDREQIKPGSPILEKLTFYYVPQDNKSRPVFLMDFCVYDKRYFKIRENQQLVLETEEYAFVTECASQNTFNNKTDKAFFDKFLSEASNEELMAEFITPPPNQKIIYKNTVAVNGKRLGGKVVCKEGGTVYVPIRETLVAMGYKIGWLAKERAITIAKGDFYHLILTDRQLAGRGYKTEIIDNKAYVSSIFFTQVLNVNIEIDENYNVSIVTSQ